MIHGDDYLSPLVLATLKDAIKRHIVKAIKANRYYSHQECMSDFPQHDFLTITEMFCEAYNDIIMKGPIYLAELTDE